MLLRGMKNKEDLYMSVYEILKERGFIEQLTHEEEIKELLEKEKITFYIGYDPTADSLHVGHYLAMVAMSHMQRAGHTPIALVGGGTAMVGDPSGKTDMRKMLTKEEIIHNSECIKKQLEKLIDFSDNKALMINNADWLWDLNYIDFLRDFGTHFSVNRMLTAECFKARMEKGLSFLEFNYMLMQAYDFYELHRRHNCVMQCGGNDQWSNIIAGADLIRRKDSKPAFGMTFTLLTNSEGKKMGKTENGAVWLDPEKTSPYDFYQYWRNVSDDVVEKCLALLTFLPMDEVRRLGALKDKEINEAKKVLAYEITKLVHSAEDAENASKAAEALFGGGNDLTNVPTTTVSHEVFGQKLLDILLNAAIIPSKAEGKRLIQQGGLHVNDEKVDSFDFVITGDSFKDGKMLVRRGKKNYNQIVLE
jgi:tyrosyl-tRNA synthetase